MLGLPGQIKVCLFDLDGVLTDTAAVHAAAWKEMFDDFLRASAEQSGGEFVPFDQHDEYDAHVDGKPRADGVRDFLASRGKAAGGGSGRSAGQADDQRAGEPEERRGAAPHP